MGGVEYGLNFFGFIVNNDVFCVVCRGLFDCFVFMIFGIDVCILGWNFQYYGFLVVGYEIYKLVIQFICVDYDVEFIIGGESFLGFGR